MSGIGNKSASVVFILVWPKSRSGLTWAGEKCPEKTACGRSINGVYILAAVDPQDKSTLSNPHARMSRGIRSTGCLSFHSFTIFGHHQTISRSPCSNPSLKIRTGKPLSEELAPRRPYDQLVLASRSTGHPNPNPIYAWCTRIGSGQRTRAQCRKSQKTGV